MYVVGSYYMDIWSMYTNMCLNLCDPEGDRACEVYWLGDASTVCLHWFMWSRGISSSYSMWSISYRAML